MVFVIVHTPWPTSKGSDHPYLHIYSCLLLCFMLVITSFVLGFATWFPWWVCGCVVTPDPMRSCSDVTIWEASLDVGFLHAYPPLFHSVRWYAYHACLCHPLAFYESLHACLHVHAWVLLASVSSMFQHNEVMDIQSQPTFVPHRHHLLFAFLLVCLRLYACLLYTHCTLSMHLFLSVTCLLVSCLCLCMYTYVVRMHGARTRFPRHKQKRARMRAWSYVQ